MSLIQLDKVSKQYGKGDKVTKAVDNVSLAIEQGSFTAIVGKSGSGKSTLLHLMGCLDKPSSGSIKLAGNDISTLKEKHLTKLRLKKIGFVFQRFYLVPMLTALQNVELPMVEAGLPRKERGEKAKDLLVKVGMENRIDHYPSQLSGGEMQRVAIARALANNADIILADEPTGELDTQSSASIIELLLNLNEEGKTIVIITHETNIARQAKNLIRLEDGRVIEAI